MQSFVTQVESLGKNATKPVLEKIIHSEEKKIKLKEMKQYMEEKWGIQRFYRNKKQALRIIGTLLLRGRSVSGSTKRLIQNELFFEEELEILVPFYKKNKLLTAKEKSRARKLLVDIEKDSYKKELELILQACQIPFKYRLKAEMLELILLTLCEKPDLKRVYLVEKGEECPICTEAMEKEGVKIPNCPCTILFHEACLENWFIRNSSCPTCRTRL